jgi:tRNA modification GTPase
MNVIYDTICAISTAYGEAGIAVIRVSGDQSIRYMNRLFSGANLSTVPSHTLTHGWIKDYRSNDLVDEVLVSVMRAPHSFTSEDVVEINCHGGIYITQYIIELLLETGARLAEPGEFTKRAYLNGKINLTQAESIMDMIEAKSKNALVVATQGLSGGVAKLIATIKHRLIDIIGVIEVNIDYPEYDDIVELTDDVLIPKLFQLLKQIDDIIEKSQTGLIMKQGVKTAIVGRPNVGKSSLLNALLSEDKAIVTSVAGTTRDLVEGTLSVRGLLLHLVDTAGIQSTLDEVEQIGIGRSYKAMDEADLVIVVLDYGSKLESVDQKLLDRVRSKNHIVVVNKVDTQRHVKLIHNPDFVYVSTITKDGMDKLQDQIIEKAGVASFHKDITYLSNTRQISKLKEARFALKEALVSAQASMPVDIISIDLQASYTALNEILGIEQTESIIDALFARFCLGK